ALVDADHRAVRARDELGGDHSRTSRHVEYAIARPGRDGAHERPPPARVLPEAERGREGVIASRQPAEQLERLALARRLRRPWHRAPIGGGDAVDAVVCGRAHLVADLKG